MRRILFLILILQLFSCSSKVKKRVTAEDKSASIVEIFPGDMKLVTVSKGEISDNGEIVCNNRALPTYVKNGNFHAYLVESYFSTLGPYKCYIRVGNVIKKHAFNVLVSTKEFSVEHLRVQPRKVHLASVDLKRVMRERKVLKGVYASYSTAPLFDRPFMIPLNSKVTSYYGVRRLFNGNKKSQHLGIDFRARVGVPIPVANNGRVAFTGNLFYTGNTVIIDHGMGIFTIYGHLNKLKSEVGEYVPRGSIIGLSGATGRVSGPHLHWGVKVLGEWISGASLVKTTIDNRDYL